MVPSRIGIALLLLGNCGIVALSAELDPQRSLVDIRRDEISMRELWALGGDELGVDDDHLYVLLSAAALDELTARGVEYTVIYDNVYEAYRTYRKNLRIQRSEPFADYHDLEAVVAAMEEIAAQHADIAALEVIGFSIEGRPIHALRISDDASVVDPEEPAMVILGCHHGREWISAEVPLFFAKHLADNYLLDAEVTRLVNYAEIWFVPVVNPDGFAYTQTDRFWRKNRRDNGDSIFGVDLNRNYSVGFGLEDSSSGVTSSGIYRGTAAFSEPETRAVRDLMQGSFGRSFDVSISYHSYGQLVLYPYNHTLESVDNAAYYDELAANMTGLINGAHSNDVYDYVYGQSGRSLYQAAGTFSDWAHDTREATAFIVELRPNGPPFFELPPAQIVPTCLENLPAFLYLAEEAMIPEARSADADGDGFVGEDDRCLHSPGGATIDRAGCAETEQDLDNDGVASLGDACPDTPPAQQVTLDGCRVATAFTLRVMSSMASVTIEVMPLDIDAAGAGDAGGTGFTRAYARETAVTLTAPAAADDSYRFVRWVVDAQPQNLGSRSITFDVSKNIGAEPVYAIPRSPVVCGVIGFVAFLGMFGGLTVLRLGRRGRFTDGIPA